ncbi:MAG: chorismate mutase [Treponema sp.]|jgi:chorismate mutase/prephenate dehydratase|nr:chorismate mutase [Treponema sp.]
MNIDELRQEVDDIDDKLLSLFERRMEIAKNIGECKKEQGLPVKDRKREQKILHRLCKKARPELEEYVRPLFLALFEVSSNYQNMQASDN